MEYERQKWGTGEGTMWGQGEVDFPKIKGWTRKNRNQRYATIIAEATVERRDS